MTLGTYRHINCLDTDAHIVEVLDFTNYYLCKVWWINRRNGSLFFNLPDTVRINKKHINNWIKISDDDNE